MRQFHTGSAGNYRRTKTPMSVKPLTEAQIAAEARREAAQAELLRRSQAIRAAAEGKVN